MSRLSSLCLPGRTSIICRRRGRLGCRSAQTATEFLSLARYSQLNYQYIIWQIFIEMWSRWLIFSFNVFFFSELDEDIQSLKQFSTELIVSSAVRCLKVINSDVDLPNTLPSGMSARFRTGTSLASIIQVCEGCFPIELFWCCKVMKVPVVKVTSIIKFLK